MDALLEKVRGGSEEALAAAVEKIKALPRDKEGVFVTEEMGAGVYSAGILVYPVYMEYETGYNKKAGYMDIAAQLTVLAERVRADYDAMHAACLLKTLTDTLAVASPEIYEHYRTLQDLLRETAALLVEKEQLAMTAFPEAHLKTDVSGKEKDALKLAGSALVEACEKDFLSAEKYAAMGRELAALA